jgi:hypothetical protein
MSAEYLEILENSEKILSDFKRQPRELEFIYSVIIDLYLAKHKFRGSNGRSKIGDLRRVLESYTLENLKEFFYSSM